MSQIRVIVAGSRSFKDYFVLNRTLEAILRKKSPQDVEIVSGTAKGADTMGERFALAHGHSVKRMPAHWHDLTVGGVVIKHNKYGPYNPLAGHQRNEKMAKYATHAVIYWDESSAGTKNMIDLARKYNLTYIVLNFKGEDIT